jgi:hypothetical protein
MHTEIWCGNPLGNVHSECQEGNSKIIINTNFKETGCEDEDENGRKLTEDSDRRRDFKLATLNLRVLITLR